MAGWMNHQQQQAIDYLREETGFSGNNLGAGDFGCQMISGAVSLRKQKDSDGSLWLRWPRL